MKSVKEKSKKVKHTRGSLFKINKCNVALIESKYRYTISSIYLFIFFDCSFLYNSKDCILGYIIFHIL